MDRVVWSELEITGSVTTELQLTALRWALSNRKTRQIDSMTRWEAGEEMERTESKFEWKVKGQKKNPIKEGRQKRERGWGRLKEVRKWGDERTMLFPEQVKTGDILTRRERDIPEPSVWRRVRWDERLRDTGRECKGQSREKLTVLRRHVHVLCYLLVAFVSLKVTDSSLMLHTLRTDTWQV